MLTFVSSRAHRLTVTYSIQKYKEYNTINYKVWSPSCRKKHCQLLNLTQVLSQVGLTVSH